VAGKLPEFYKVWQASAKLPRTLGLPPPPGGGLRTHIQMCVFESFVWQAEGLDRPFWQIGKSLSRTAEHVIQLAADTRLSFIQPFELQNNGSVPPSILLTCLPRLCGSVPPSILLTCLSRLIGRIELDFWTY